MDFLSLLADLGETPGDVLLCTVDIVGLYPSIPQDEGLEVMRHALNSQGRREGGNGGAICPRTSGSNGFHN